MYKLICKQSALKFMSSNITSVQHFTFKIVDFIHLILIKRLKRLDDTGIRTQAPCRRDVNSGVHITRFMDRILNCIVPLVSSSKILVNHKLRERELFSKIGCFVLFSSFYLKDCKKN